MQVAGVIAALAVAAPTVTAIELVKVVPQVVKLYVIICVPTPAAEGLNAFADTPTPENVPPAGVADKGTGVVELEQ